MQFPASSAVLHQSVVAAGDGAIMDVRGCSSVTVQIVGITTATVTFKARQDGSNWVTIPAKNKASGAEATTATADGLYDVPIHGCSEFIADITAWTAGTITITALGIAGGVQAPHTSVAAVLGAIDTELPAAAAAADNTANPTAPAVVSFGMVWDGATWDRMPGTSAAGTKVQPATGGAGAVDATTARTTLASDDPAVTALQIIDDWDETNRAAVNTIAGQVGVQGGAGVVTALSQRVAIATDANVVDTELMAAAALADAASATPTTSSVGAVPLLMNATTVDRQRAVVAAMDSVGTGVAAAGLVGQLDDVGTAAVTENQFAPVRISTRRALLVEGVASGTTIPVTEASAAASAASLSVMDDWDNTASDGASVSGDVAHDGVDAGEPVKVGHVAIAHGTNPTAVAAADRTNWYANRAGVPWVIGGHPNVQTVTTHILDATGAQTDLALVTAAGGEKIVVTRVSIAADNDNTADINVKVGFGAATLPADSAGAGAAGILAHHPGVPAGGGMTVGDGSGILGIGADGEDIRLTCEDPTGGSVTISLSYYTVPS